MEEPDPAEASRAFGLRGGNLALRIGSALVLAPLAIAAAYLGGWPFVAFWALAAIGVLWEWMSLVAFEQRRTLLVVGAVALAVTFGLAGAGRMVEALIVIILATAAGVALSHRRAWVAAGIPYAGAIGIAPIVLRSDAEYGFAAVILVFATVWATDILAYFIGRAVGGPKLMPRVSPNKTWSGATGGTIAAVLAAIAVAKGAGLAGLSAIMLVGALLSAASQIGDLSESALKRRFGAKDASHLIPGHGGLMDRLDGFVVAATLAALIGLLRGGLESPARGLLVW